MGGDCVDGQCQPVTLAEHIGAPGCIAVGSKHVYWCDTNSVMRVPLAGGAPEIFEDGTMPVSIALDSQYAYWTDHGATAVRRKPFAGGPLETLAKGIDSDQINQIAIDTSHVFWTNTMALTVLKVPLGGGSTEVVSSGLGYPGAIVVGPTGVFWASGLGETEALYYVAPQGGEPVALATQTKDPFGALTIDATSIYWIAPMADKLERMPIAGGPTTVVAEGLHNRGLLAIDATHAYFAYSTVDGFSEGHGAIGRIPLAGGPMEGLVDSLCRPTTLAVDDVAVYFGDTNDCGNGKVVRLAK